MSYLHRLCNKRAFASGALIGAGVGGVSKALGGHDADDVVGGVAHGAATGAGAHLGAIGGGVLAHLLARHFEASPKTNLLATLTGAGLGGLGGGLVGHKLTKTVLPKKDKTEEKDEPPKEDKLASVVRRVINGDEGLDQLINHLKSARYRRQKDGCK
jgi:hypothetical protein